MSAIYDLIGRIVVGFVRDRYRQDELIGRIIVGFVRVRYRQQIRTATAVGAGVAVLAAIGAYAAAKESDERD